MYCFFFSCYKLKVPIIISLTNIYIYISFFKLFLISYMVNISCAMQILIDGFTFFRLFRKVQLQCSGYHFVAHTMKW